MMQIGIGLGLGWLGGPVAGSGGPGPSQPAIPGTLRNPAMGMVLHWPSASGASHSPFIDVLKIATEWRSSPQSGQAQMNWSALVAGGHITPTGTINNIPAGQDNLVMDALGYMSAESGASGRYRLYYTCRVPDAGGNIWIMGGASNTDNSVPGQIDFDFTANGSSSVTILMVGVPSDGDGPAPITLRALVKHDHVARHAAGEVFDPAWLDVIRNSRVLRFGDWQGVDYYTGSAAWADRTPVDRITYDGAAGVPFEHQFTLCNLVGADPWINILSPADDTYCTNLAAMARAQLGPSRRIYVELSNKTWDSTNWVTANHFRGLAVAQFGDNSVEACMEAYGGRSAEVFAIWRAEWAGADADRLRTVLQGWTGVAYHDSYIMDAPRWVAAASGRVAPWTLATDFALQNVIDGGLRYGWMPGNLALLDSWFADLASSEMTEQELIGEFASALRGTNPQIIEQGYDIASLGANYDEHLTYLATRPLNVICYESGSHLCVPPERSGNQTWIDFYRTFHRSPEGAAAFADARSMFFGKFPSAETVIAYRCDVRKPDQNQSEGLYFYLGDTTGNNPLTRWNADQAARTGATGRGDDAFVGSIEAGTADLDLTNVQRVVVIGASIMNMLAGNNLTTRHWESTNALNMPGIDVFGGSTAGEAMAAQIDNVAAALAAFPEVGETVFLLHTGGNDITPRVPFSGASAGDLQSMRDNLNAVLDAFGDHLPYVAAMPPSFRSYTAQGFGARELFNDQMEGSLGFNEAVFKPIYAARINPRWRYADGESVMCFYDQVRNDFETWLSDGIHITWTSARRSAVLGRLAAAIAGNRPVRVTPAPADAAGPVFTAPASIAPVSGPVGTVFTLGNGTLTGDAPITVSGVLTLDGVDVTSEIAAGQYTSTAEGDLVWTVTASNAVASGVTSSDTATVGAVAGDLVAYVSYTDTPSGATGLNELPNAYANAVTDTSGPVANLVDRTGAALGWTYQARSPSSSATVGVGINPGTIAGDATVLAFDGSTILADEVIAASLYAPAAQNVIHAVGGLIPGRSYEFRFVGSRMGSAGRISRFTEPGGTYVEVDPNLQPSTSNAPSAPLTATANAGGFVLITQSASAGAFSYLGGFSIRQVEV